MNHSQLIEWFIDSEKDRMIGIHVQKCGNLRISSLTKILNKKRRNGMICRSTELIKQEMPRSLFGKGCHYIRKIFLSGIYRFN